MDFKIFTPSGVEKLSIPDTERKDSNGNVYAICPYCSSNRKPQHQNEKKLAVNIDKPHKPWRCNHCGIHGRVLTGEKLKSSKSLKPLSLKRGLDKIPPEVLNYMYESRGLSKRSLEHFGVSSSVVKMKKVRVSKKNKKFLGDYKEELCIAFPSYDGESIFDIQYRDGDKNFGSVSGSTKILWNVNSIKDEKKAYITEGRVDCISIYESGITDCGMVSVPNGVTMSPQEIEYFERTGKIDSSKQLNLSYLDHHWQEIEKLENVIIATDADAPGIKLREELARRIGKHKCQYIDFSVVPIIEKGKEKRAKDANDVLVKGKVNGSTEDKKRENRKKLLNYVLSNPKEFPVSGIATIDDVWGELKQEYYNGKEKGLDIGYKTIKPHFTVFPGHTIGINGYRNQGKTTFAFNLGIIMAHKYDWRIGIYSPENYPLKRAFDSIIEIVAGGSTDSDAPNRIPMSLMESAAEWVRDKVFFVEDDGDDGFTPKKLREKCKELILRYGIKMFIKDPWNNLTEERRPNEGLDTYLNRELANEVRFGRKYGIANVICVHPKTPKDVKNLTCPSDLELYGGAVWGNKLHEIIAIHKDRNNGLRGTNTEFHSQKIKEQKITGLPTEKNPITIEFSRKSNRYYEVINGKKYCPLDDLILNPVRQTEIEGF